MLSHLSTPGEFMVSIQLISPASGEEHKIMANFNLVRFVSIQLISPASGEFRWSGS